MLPPVGLRDTAGRHRWAVVWVVFLIYEQQLCKCEDEPRRPANTQLVLRLALFLPSAGVTSSGWGFWPVAAPPGRTDSVCFGIIVFHANFLACCHVW